MSGVYKYFLCSFVDDQSSVINLRAVVLFMRGIRTRNNSRRMCRISLGERVSPSLHRIFLISLRFGDRLSFHRPLFLPFTPYTAYARVGSVRALLRVKNRAEGKKPRYNC